MRSLDPHTVAVDGKALYGERILIATGSRPQVPAIQGLQEVPYLTSDLLTADEAQELTHCPRSLLIVGGGYIAVELGQMFRRFGAEVTLVEMEAQLFPRYEPEVGPTVASLLQAEGIQILTDASVVSVSQEGEEVIAQITQKGRKLTVRAEAFTSRDGRSSSRSWPGSISPSSSSRASSTPTRQPKTLIGRSGSVVQPTVIPAFSPHGASR